MVLDFILDTNGFGAYSLVFAFLLGGAFGLPIPEDLALIAAGILIHLGKAEAPIMALVCYIGIICGDMIIYRIGYLAGPTLFRQRWFRRLVKSSRVQWIRSNLERRAFLTIFIARHLFYLRTGTFLVCGAVRLSFVRFCVCDLLSALITTYLMLSVGYFFALHQEQLFSWMSQVKTGLVAIGIVGAVLIGYRVWFGKSEEEELEELNNKNS